MMTLVLMMLAQLSVPELEVPGEFKQVEKGSFGVLSQRPVKGSVFHETRLQADTPYSVKHWCDAVWVMVTSGATPGITLHKELVNEPNHRVYYEQVSYPIISKRDYAMTTERTPELDGGACRIRFRATNSKAPPVPNDFVRIEKLYGEWLFEPSAAGARVTYRIFSDPAGAIPPFLVHGQIIEKTKFSYNEGLKVTKRAAEAKK